MNKVKVNPLQFLLELKNQIFEQISIMNNENQVIGKTSRLKSFLFRKPHLGVHVFIFKDQSFRELLLQKRQIWIRFPFKKGAVMGAVSHDLSYRDAAYKELQEELFHKIPFPNIKLEKIAEFKDTSTTPFTYNHLFLGICQGPFSPSLLEMKEIFYISIQKIQHDLKDPKTSRQYALPFKQSFRHFLIWKEKGY